MNTVFLPTNGFLVIERDEYGEEFKSKLNQTNRFVKPAYVEGVLKGYRGVEGRPWFLEEPTNGIDLKSGLAPIEQYELVYTFYRKKCGSKNVCDFIYLHNGLEKNAGEMTIPNCIFCGYDYGIYASEWNNYSVLFYEVLFGVYEELRTLSNNVNEYYLLPSIEIVTQVEKTRQKLIESNSNISLETYEEGECFGPIAVYGIKS
jgi:hypothetical protein